MEKKKLITYWIATGLLTFGMLGSGFAQIFHAAEMETMVTNLGYPSYFLTIIGVWKILAIVAILLPGFKLVKEWAYAGLFFVMTGAFISHLATENIGFKELIAPIMQTVFIIISWYTRPANRKLNTENL